MWKDIHFPCMFEALGQSDEERNTSVLSFGAVIGCTESEKKRARVAISIPLWLLGKVGLLLLKPPE